MGIKYILSERRDGVGLITLNRPAKLNALSFGLMQEFDRALTGYEEDDEHQGRRRRRARRPGVFRPAPTSTEWPAFSADELAKLSSSVRGEISWHIASYSKPLIGAINGLAYGGAALLSSSLDIRVGCEKTRVPFTWRRAMAGWVELVVADAGRAGQRPKKLLFTGRVVARRGGRSASGLLNQDRAAGKVASRPASRSARSIAKTDPRMGPGIKKLLHENAGMNWRERYDIEEEARGTWLLAGHPRDGFKDFLARKGKR